MQILSRVKFYDARTTWEEHWIGLSNFGRKKAGAGKLSGGMGKLGAGKLRQKICIFQKYMV